MSGQVRLSVELVQFQIYTWIDPVTQRVHHFNATAALEDCLRDPLPPGAERIKFVIQPEHVAMILRDRGVDPDYARRLPIEKLKQPVIALHNPEDDTTLVIDGHHRYVRWAELGLAEGIMVRISGRENWRRYLLELSPSDSARLAADVRAVPATEVPPDQRPFSVGEG